MKAVPPIKCEKTGCSVLSMIANSSRSAVCACAQRKVCGDASV
jgi:hypothetical protein